MTGKISINMVLAEIRKGKEFRLTFVRGTGRKQGSLRFGKYLYGIAYKGNKKVRNRTARHKYRGTIPLIDIETEDMVTPFISHMTHYNGLEIRF